MWHKMAGYPRVGARVKVTGFWGKKGINVVGKVQPSRKNPREAAFRTRSGAVMATLITDQGKRVSIPWSTGVVEFWYWRE